MQAIKQITISLYVLTTLAGCTTVPSSYSDDEEQVEIETKSRAKNTILTIGGILLLGAIIANEAEDGVEDAVRDATHP